MTDEISIENNNVEQLIEQQNIGWVRLFPENPELENPFMMWIMNNKIAGIIMMLPMIVITILTCIHLYTYNYMLLITVIKLFVSMFIMMGILMSFVIGAKKLGIL